MCCINKKALRRRVMLLSGFLGLWITTSFATTTTYTIEPRRKRRPVSTKPFHSLFKCWSCGFLYCNQITGEESPFGAAAGRPWWLAAVKWSLLQYKVRLIFAQPGGAVRHHWCRQLNGSYIYVRSVILLCLNGKLVTYVLVKYFGTKPFYLFYHVNTYRQDYLCVCKWSLIFNIKCSQ